MQQQKHSRRGRPMGEGWQGAETRAAILDAAERRFADLGYAATRLQDVAEDVGKTAPAVAHFFGNKETLYRAVLERMAADYAAYLSEHSAPPESDELTRILATVTAWLRFMRKRPSQLGLILRDMAERRLQPLGEATLTRIFEPYSVPVQEQSLRQEGGVIFNLAWGGGIIFMVSAAHFSDPDFERALSRHLRALRLALEANTGIHR
ncbi:TetR/AcrR family transcriptional regulator [Parahaliea aestuarii]|uniref:TetR/AcrR family transcriptional regulator n=1 Tax=Parahaliea aestuarii TaxID=1852021 RepID=A0A5C8ZMF0_9GAMM|nr:TetR/AcrR family transcriptional regulator [Parahaliea aestuarii]TXS88910.1 TetR/AcrR family transcriptional regulator [Parahaliea aestuarii]